MYHETYCTQGYQSGVPVEQSFYHRDDSSEGMIATLKKVSVLSKTPKKRLSATEKNTFLCVICFSKTLFKTQKYVFPKNTY